MRFHELAKKHGFNVQDLLYAVNNEGFEVKDTLSVVDGQTEAWVAGKAREKWVPPAAPKAKGGKKKIKVVKPVVPEPESVQETKPEPAPAEATPAPESAPKTEETPAPKAEEKKPEPAQAQPVSAPESAPKTEETPAPKADEKKPEPAQEAQPVPAPETAPKAEDKPAPKTEEKKPEPAPKPVEVKRVNPAVTGRAIVGQASPEMIAQLKRAAAASGKGGADDDRRGRKGGQAARPAQPKPQPQPQAPRTEQVMPDMDLSGKPMSKQRVKTKYRAGQDQEERDGEKKIKNIKKGRQEDESWGMDDDDDSYDTYDAPAEQQRDAASDQLERDGLLITDEGQERTSGYKHRRADFKSKNLHHELPASFAEIDNEFTRSLAGGGRRRQGRGGGGRRVVGRRAHTRHAPVQRAAGQDAVVRLGMTLRDLSVALGIKLQEILGYLLGQGLMVQVNDILAEEQINQISQKFNIPIKWESDEDLEEELVQETENQALEGSEQDIIERPPVVTFMGHVDHGKTSLLDAIRNTRVVDGEHGGITQHIGAYSIVKNDKRVSFLDTPGHEAFSAMRARGANLTDIAVLVVAADDGVMPQTEEAASHAKNAGVPIVVAINKCDLPSANPDRVRQELANRLELLPEEWGGRIGMIEVSAHTKEGIDDLVERILLEAEVLELRANPNRPATGFVVEAKMSEGQGVVSTLLVGDGTLHVGDVLLCSNGYGKIRFMFDEFGRQIQQAGPGIPVRVSGLSAVPEAGDKFFILSDILKARAIAEQRERESRQAAMAKRQHVTLENLTSHLAGSGKRELSVIVKADVVGSLEVIEKTLRDMATDEVGINIIHSAVGGINHADVVLADASDALVLGFHVGVEHQARQSATSLGVQIRTYHIIYRMIEDMKAALEGLLPPEEKEVVQGHVEIRQVFRSSKVGAIAGCYVTDGLIQRTSRVRLYRNNMVIYDGTIQSLRRVKDDAREVKSGFECGIKIANYDAIEQGDVIEAYSIEEIARKL